MCGGRGFVERAHRDRQEYVVLHGKRFLECGATLGFGNVIGERRPWRRHAGALGLGRGRLRFGAADSGDLTFAACDTLCGFVQKAYRTLAADRAVIEMCRVDAESSG